MKISVSYDFLPKQNSVRAAQVMDHFGIGFEQGRRVIVEGLELAIQPGQIVLFTGDSGSGKSSLMRAVARRLNLAAGEPSDDSAVLVLDELPLPDALLVDLLSLPAPQAMQLLSTCGLGEAHLMLRTPAELSDGQRYRFRLALALSRRPQWVLADEFTATLDRTLAKVVAFNLRRLADREQLGFLLATTHEDVAADLQPDLHVRCSLDGNIVVEQDAAPTRGPLETGTGGGGVSDRSPGPPRPPVASVRRHPSRANRPAGDKKKDPSPSPGNSGSPPRPVATGRTSLGGIIAAITSASPGD
jgi:ABC-type ATPase with predicted acetyltransferase domain